jgi:hypothetical protein
MSLAFPLSNVREGTLCENCQKIDFTEALETPMAGNWGPWTCPEEGVLVAIITQFSPSCDLCAELLSQRGFLERLFRLQLEDGQHYELRAFPLLEIHPAAMPTHISTLGTVWLHIKPAPFCSDVTLCRSLRNWAENDGLIYVKVSTDLKQMLHPLVLNQRFDTGRTRNWISTCKESHMARCTPTVSLPNLSLIDCTTLELRKFLNPPTYVALSYVWGQVAPAISTNPLEARAQPTLPSMNHMSQVIKDAMSVTETLGFRFLWVDKYCVDQVDEMTKKHQIDNMDRISSGAELTIIAASREDEHHGLSGVSSERAQAEPFTTGPFTIARSPEVPFGAVGRSRWATRGWTYQEEFLSHRRLYFLPDQVLFVCLEMTCRESLGGVELCSSYEEVAEYSHVTRRTRFDGSFFDQKLNELEMMGYRLADYANVVQLYSARNLTFDEDALRAFAGIQRAFERGSHPIGAICGLPIPLADSMSTKHLEIAITLCLCWQTNANGRLHRRDFFPSWSWAGWAERNSMPIGKNCFESRIQLREIRCGYDDGYTAPLAEISQSLLATVQSREIGWNHQLPCFLTKQAVANPIRDWSSPKSINFTAPCADMNKIFLSEDEEIPHRYHLATARKYRPISTSSPLATSLISSGLQTDALACLVLGIVTIMSSTKGLSFDLNLLLVEWTQPGEAHRIGKLTMEISSENMDPMEEHIDSLPRVQVRLW